MLNIKTTSCVLTILIHIIPLLHMFKTNVHRKEVVNESGFPLFAHAKPHLFSMVNDLFLERTMFETRFVKVLKASVASRW
jgi:hypothetical protein